MEREFSKKNVQPKKDKECQKRIPQEELIEKLNRVSKLAEKIIDEMNKTSSG